MSSFQQDTFQTYLDDLGLDGEKWSQIFKENLCVTNQAGLKRLKQKHYMRIEIFILKDAPEEDIIKEIFKIEETSSGSPQTITLKNKDPQEDQNTPDNSQDLLFAKDAVIEVLRSEIQRKDELLKQLSEELADLKIEKDEQKELLTKKEQKIVKLSEILQAKDDEIKKVEELLQVAMENMSVQDITLQDKYLHEPMMSQQSSIVAIQQAQEQNKDLLPFTPGQASNEAKQRWNELGVLSLEEIFANSQVEIDMNLQFGQSKNNKYLMGQLDKSGKVNGVGKEINNSIYEGQLKNDVYHGYGRFIYSNGNYYVGQWIDGKKQGQGKLVDVTGNIYEGFWHQSKFVGHKK